MSAPVNFTLVSITDPNARAEAKKKQSLVLVNGQFSISPRHLNKIVEGMNTTLATYRDALDENASYGTMPYSILMKALGRIEEAKPLNMWLSLESGYTVAIGGDVSEAGFDSETQCAMVPSFDIPSSFINDEARQFRFSNKTTI